MKIPSGELELSGFRWSRIVVAVALSVFTSAAVSAQTAQRPEPLHRPSITDMRSSVTFDRRSGHVVRLPPVGSLALPGVPSPNGLPGVSRRGNVVADGTWSEDQQYLVINLDGQQYRLIKTDSQTAPDSTSPENLGGGAVNGRLSHRGEPLVNCEVAIIPLKKSWTGYKLHQSGALLARTDRKGAYFLSNVPAGPYKLKWRPAGESSWIRRAEVRPDVQVRTSETSQVKEIRVALQTIN